MGETDVGCTLEYVARWVCVSPEELPSELVVLLLSVLGVPPVPVSSLSRCRQWSPVDSESGSWWCVNGPVPDDKGSLTLGDEP